MFNQKEGFELFASIDFTLAHCGHLKDVLHHNGANSTISIHLVTHLGDKICINDDDDGQSIMIISTLSDKKF